LQPTFACAFSKRAPVSRSAVRSGGSGRISQFHAGTHASVDRTRLRRSTREGARRGSVIVSSCSGVTEPLTLRRNSDHDLTFGGSLRNRQDRFHSAVVKRAELSRSKAPSIVRGTSASRGPWESDVPGSHRIRLTARRVFASNALPDSKAELVVGRYPPGFLLFRAAPEAARRPSISAAQSTHGHSPQATSPLRLYKEHA